MESNAFESLNPYLGFINSIKLTRWTTGEVPSSARRQSSLESNCAKFLLSVYCTINTVTQVRIHTHIAESTLNYSNLCSAISGASSASAVWVRLDLWRTRLPVRPILWICSNDESHLYWRRSRHRRRGANARGTPTCRWCTLAVDLMKVLSSMYESNRTEAIQSEIASAIVH